MIKLKQLHIKNYKSIKDSGSIEDITKIFALIGRNNTGKSAFLKAIQVLFCEREIQPRDFHKGTNENIEILGTIERRIDDEVTEVQFNVVCEKDGSPVYSIDGAEIKRKPDYKKKGPSLLIVRDIRDPNDSTTAGQRKTLLKQVMEIGVKDGDDELSEEFAEISEKLEDLKNREAEAISKAVTAKFRDVVAESAYSISITPDINLDKAIVHKTDITNSAIADCQEVDIVESGTGLQSMYLLALLELYGEMSKKSDEAILLVEEPEVYLHPDYQRRMFRALRRIARDNQVIFTSHSPIMIADIWLTESVRQVRLNEHGETLIETVKIENVIDELGIRYEDVLNPSLVVFVEGNGDIEFYRKLGLTNSRLKIISSDRFRALNYFAFIKIISSEHVRNNFVIIADSDGTVPDERSQELRDEIYSQFQDPPPGLEEKLEGKIFVLEEYSIESYFLNLDTMSKSFPKLDKTQLEAFISEYFKHYARRKKELKEKKLGLQEFQKYMKPKRIIETLEPAKFAEAYKEFWAGYDTFITLRDSIAEECRKLGMKDVKPFDHILANADLEDIPELTEKRDQILSLLE